MLANVLGDDFKGLFYRQGIEIWNDQLALLRALVIVFGLYSFDFRVLLFFRFLHSFATLGRFRHRCAGLLRWLRVFLWVQFFLTHHLQIFVVSGMKQLPCCFRLLS